jgi:hypothetical protein
MSHRLRYQIYALALESFYSHVRNKDVPKSIYCSGLLLVQGPKDPYFHFIVARGFAQLNLIDQALNHLEQAIDNGWKNRDAIRDEACFRRIQNNARYRKLMQGI